MWVVSANTQFATVTEQTISGVHVSPGSAETLVRRGGIACSLSNISAKNYQNRWCALKLRCATSVSFLRRCIFTRLGNCRTCCPVLWGTMHDNLRGINPFIPLYPLEYARALSNQAECNVRAYRELRQNENGTGTWKWTANAFSRRQSGCINVRFCSTHVGLGPWPLLHFSFTFHCLATPFNGCPPNYCREWGS